MQKLVDAFLREMEVACRSKHTIRSYKGALKEFLAWCESDGGLMKPKDIDNDALHDYVAHLRTREPRLSPMTVQRHLISVRNWRRWLGHHRHAPELMNMPMVGGADKRLPKALSRAEVDALLRAPDPETAMGVRDRAILEVLYSSGCRNAELCGISIGDMDLGAGVVKVLGKGKRERMVALGVHARRAVQLYLRHPERPLPQRGHSKAVFLTRFGMRVDERTIHRLVVRAALRAGLGRSFGPHVLRHSFATHLIRAGAPILQVSRLLGHSSVATTEIYIKVAANDVLDAFDRLHPRAGDVDHSKIG